MAQQQQAAGKATKTAKKKVVKVDAYGKAFINATFNNIIISLCNDQGQVISWASAGKGIQGFEEEHSVRCAACCRRLREDCIRPRTP